jgi:endonuclease/exonuclease/phosphatase (EEP) superfamily protein YafD
VENKHKNFSGFISYVIAENPDVLIIQETTELWIHRLQVLEERFPYNKALPRPWSIGIALYSRVPVEQFDVIALGSESRRPQRCGTSP